MVYLRDYLVLLTIGVTFGRPWSLSPTISFDSLICVFIEYTTLKSSIRP